MKIKVPRKLEKFRFFSEIDELQDIVTRGVKEALENASKKYDTENFYVFGIDIPNDFGAIYFGGNTEENFSRIIAANDCSDSMKQYYRWCWHEWGAYEVLEPQPIMKKIWTWVQERDELLGIQNEKLNELYYDHQGQMMLSIAKKSLKENDTLGLFGTGKVRDKVILYASVGGFDDEIFMSSVLELNPQSAIPITLQKML